MISKGSVSDALAINSRDAPVKGFGGIPGSFSKLLVVTWPLNKVQQLLGEVGIWEGRGVVLCHQPLSWLRCSSLAVI